MKAADSCWSGLVWFWGFVFIFLTHAFAVFWLAERESLSPAWRKPTAFLYLSVDPDIDERFTQHTDVRDPTLFALPHGAGFSGEAWLNFRPPTLRLSNWSPPLEWLPLPVADLGRALDAYVATNRPAEEELLTSVRATKTTEIRLPDRPLLTNSTVKVQGLPPDRTLASSPPLPTLITNDVLSSTVVTIAVNHDGIVESAAVTRESGSRGVDDRAVQLARAFMFNPAPRLPRQASPTFGQLIFTWHTAPATNVAAAPSSATTP